MNTFKLNLQSSYYLMSKGNKNVAIKKRKGGNQQTSIPDEQTPKIILKYLQIEPKANEKDHIPRVSRLQSGGGRLQHCTQTDECHVAQAQNQRWKPYSHLSRHRTSLFMRAIIPPQPKENT